jgi:vancomycin resistance protein YoaR
MTLPANQRLEDLFDMPRSDGVVADQSDSDEAEVGNDIQTNLPVLPETLAALDKIESALPAVRGLEASDREMDDLASKASESFDDLMSLGMQVDSRYASEIFAVASTMLGHAITAKTAKMNKKLKMIDLQLKKARLDQTEDSRPHTPTAEGRVLNRNDLLRTLLSRDQEKTAADK